MAYRFTNTDKWHSDSWYIDLKPMEKLLFIYLCENCDIAGFLEISFKKISFDIGTDQETIKNAFAGIEKSLIWSGDLKMIFLKNFIKHQKNLPLNPDNKSHVGIINRLKNNTEMFGYQSYNYFITDNQRGCQAPSKGLPSPTGIGNSITNSGNKEKGGVGEKTDPSIVIYDPKVLYTEFINSEQWQENIMRSEYAKGLKKDKLKNYIIQFIQELRDKDELTKSFSEYKRYFINWLKVELKKTKTAGPAQFRSKPVDQIIKENEERWNREFVPPVGN